jgi:hypothetical protein
VHKSQGQVAQMIKFCTVVHNCFWDPQCGICFMSPNWHMKFWAGTCISGKFVESCYNILVFMIKWDQKNLSQISQLICDVNWPSDVNKLRNTSKKIQNNFKNKKKVWKFGFNKIWTHFKNITYIKGFTVSFHKAQRWLTSLNDRHSLLELSVQ